MGRPRITQCRNCGATVEWGDPVHVEMSQERFRNLQLIKDEAVFVIPKDLKVFEAKGELTE